LRILKFLVKRVLKQVLKKFGKIPLEILVEMYLPVLGKIATIIIGLLEKKILDL